MTSKLYQFINGLRSCLSCGIQVQITDEMLCPWCLEKLEILNGTKASELNKYRTYLYKWRKDQSPILNALVLSLKKWNWPQTYAAYAQKLIIRAQASGFQFTEDTVIIHAPSRAPNKKDHAYQLAVHISLITGSPLQLALKRQCREYLEQKTRTKQGRFSLRFDRNENFTQLNFADKQILFVDDVITTGATARAAYLALGRPKRFHVWVIASRTSLAEEDYDLV